MNPETSVSLRKLGISLLVLFALSVAVMAFPGATAASAQEVDTVAGNGTVDDPYQITNVTELQAMEDDLSAHYILANNIDASETADWNDEGNGSLGFAPVGNYSEPFNGSFDGDGHDIVGLTINRTDQSDVGLFGYSDGVIENVALVDADVVGDGAVGALTGGIDSGVVRDASVSGTVSGIGNVGGLVGQSMYSSVVSDTSSTADVSGADLVGGLLGYNHQGPVENSSASGTVEGDWYVGGLVGNHDRGAIANSSAGGNVTGVEIIGGLVGWNTEATVSNSSASGTVNGSENRVGGLVGETSSGSIADSFANGDVNGTESVGGLVGLDNGELLTNSSASGTVTGTDDVGGLAGSTSGRINESWASGNVHSSQWAGGLVGISHNGTVDRSFATGTVTSDGNVVGGLVAENTENATITRSYAAGSTEAAGGAVGGLVGYNTDNGLIASSYAVGSVDGGYNVGGLVGDHSNGSIESSYATGSVAGNDTVGGLVGYAGGPVSDSWASGNVLGRMNVGGLVGGNDGSIAVSYATGNVASNSTQEAYAGGLVGLNSGTIVQSFATGDATSSGDLTGGLVGQNGDEDGDVDGEIEDAYATGDVDGHEAVGGLVGGNYLGNVTTSFAVGDVNGTDFDGGLIGASHTTSVSGAYWDVNASGRNDSADDATGLTTAEMQGAAAESNMTGFDFGGNWTATDAYPHLSWEIESLSLGLDETDLSGSETTQATPTLSLVDGSTVTANETVNYTSDNESVATVAENGTVTGTGTGSATIEATLVATDSVSVTVSPAFTLSELDPATDRLPVGSPLDIAVTVENDASGQATGNVTFDAGPLTVTETVTLAGGENTTVPFSNLDTTALDIGEVPYTVTTATDSVGSTLTVTDQIYVANYTVSSTETTLGQSVTVTATVRNVDDTQRNLTVPVVVGNQTVASQTVEVAAGANATVPLEWSLVGENWTPNAVTQNLTVEDLSPTTVTVYGPDLNGNGEPAADTTEDGRLNDLDGNGTTEIFDVQLLFGGLGSPVLETYPELFNFQGEEPDRVNVFDVQALFTLTG